MISGFLDSIDCFILDMDGTLYIDDQLLPGAFDLISQLIDVGKKFYFLTNNSSRGKDQYLEKLVGFGLPVDENNFLTSGEATALYVKENFPKSKVFLLGTEELKAEFHKNGILISENYPDILVLGYDTSITYKKLSKFCSWLFTDMLYIATHPDINCPSKDGLIPDIGSMMAFIETVTGRRPDAIIGKPFKPMMSVLSQKAGVSFDRMAIVGDRLYTDIALGQFGVKTIMVLTGETKVADLEGTSIRSDLVIEDLRDLVQALK